MACLLLLAGCGEEAGPLHPNQPPETVITYAGPVDTVNSHLRVRWWGEDADGDVVGYETRWTFAGTTEPGPWTFTAATTDSFPLPAPLGAAVHIFEVRAVDDSGLRDPTPARQDYAVRDRRPRILFSDPAGLDDVTLPAVTIVFRVLDDDGQDTIGETEAWLDGAEDRPHRIAWPESLATFAPADFDRYGQRTLYLRAKDDAGAASDVISHTWTVTAPVGEVLLVDDMPDAIAGALTFTDPFYRAALDSVLGGRPYTVHKIEDAAFRTTDEAAAILGLFDVVVWYQGTNAVVGGQNQAVDVTSLRRSAGAIRDLLARGGRMLLSTMNAVGTGGAFDPTFAREVLGVESVLPNPSRPAGDTNFFLKTRYVAGQPPWDLAAAPGSGLSDVRAIGSFWGLELFRSAPGATALYTIPAGIVFPGQEAMAVATRVRGAGDPAGTLIYLGFPLSRCSFEDRHREVIRTILRTELGL